jgi:hypothetical protein
MPTYDVDTTFLRDFARLTPNQRAAFRRVLPRFIAAVAAGRFPAGPRVKGLQGQPGVYEMTWAADGRAMLCHGEQVQAGEPHIIWLRIGTRAIFDER